MKRLSPRVSSSHSVMNPEICIIRYACTGVNRPKEARAALERVLELQPENLSARANLVAACSELGDLDRAIALSDGVDQPASRYRCRKLCV